MTSELLNLVQYQLVVILYISIFHECEGGIEKSVPRFTDWHHEACRGTEFLSNPHTNNGLLFLLTTKCLILFKKDMRRTNINLSKYKIEVSSFDDLSLISV